MGDYIYYLNSIKLINKFKPGIKIVEVNAFKPLLKQIDSKILNQIKAIIIPGGPALRSDLYPNMYNIPSVIFKQKIPIIFLGIGTKFYPGSISKMRKLKLSRGALYLINYVIKRGYQVGVRDNLSKYLLLENGIEDVIINGCPSWYDLDYLHKKFEIPKEIKKIAFSTPANQLFFKQAKDIIDKLSQEFPEAKLTISFHKGLDVGSGRITTRTSKFNKELATYSIKKGLTIVDTSLKSENLSLYDKSDILVGYRVHGHYYALSHRKPSFLIAEDSRGNGALMTLGDVGAVGWTKQAEILCQSKPLWKPIEFWLKYLGPNLFFNDLITKRDLSETIVTLIKNEIDDKFNSFEKIPKLIENYFERNMKRFILNLPE